MIADGTLAQSVGFQRGDVRGLGQQHQDRQDPRPGEARRRPARASGASSSSAAASRFPPCSGDDDGDPRQTRRGRPTKPVCGGGARCRRAAAARRQAAAAEACRRGRPGSSARPRRRADADAGKQLARLADLLGPARHRQDHGGAAAGARDQPRIRADFRDLLRRRRSQEGVRRGPRAARDRAGHAAVRRRDPPLQPRPAGQLPAGDGGRHHRAGRRHHRKSVVRADRADAVAGARAGVQVARCRGDREAAGARRGARGQDAAARRRERACRSRAWPTATAALR